MAKGKQQVAKNPHPPTYGEIQERLKVLEASEKKAWDEYSAACDKAYADRETRDLQEHEINDLNEDWMMAVALSFRVGEIKWVLTGEQTDVLTVRCH
jgi:hypothetical protein